MLLQTILAETQTVHGYMQNPTSIPNRNEVHNWCQHMDSLTAALLIVGGLVFLLSGYKLHRILLALTGAVLGAYIGGRLGGQYGLQWPGLAIGLLLLGLAAWYVTAWSAAVLGALVGALLGAAVWNMTGQNPAFAWSGALTGAVTLGLLSFIIFRISVILFTSFQGAVMLVLGILGMAYTYEALRPSLDRSLGSSPYILPGSIVGFMLAGLLYQYMKGPAGGGGSSGSSAKAPAAAKKE